MRNTTRARHARRGDGWQEWQGVAGGTTWNCFKRLECWSTVAKRDTTRRHAFQLSSCQPPSTACPGAGHGRMVPHLCPLPPSSPRSRLQVCRDQPHPRLYLVLYVLDLHTVLLFPRLTSPISFSLDIPLVTRAALYPPRTQNRYR